MVLWEQGDQETLYQEAAYESNQNTIFAKFSQVGATKLDIWYRLLQRTRAKRSDKV